MSKFNTVAWLKLSVFIIKYSISGLCTACSVSNRILALKQLLPKDGEQLLVLDVTEHASPTFQLRIEPTQFLNDELFIIQDVRNGYY